MDQDSDLLFRVPTLVAAVLGFNVQIVQLQVIVLLRIYLQWSHEGLAAFRLLILLDQKLGTSCADS